MILNFSVGHDKSYFQNAPVATEYSFEELQASRWRRQEKLKLEKEEMESEKADLENQFEALKLMVEPYRYFTKSKLMLSYFNDLGPVFHL